MMKFKLTASEKADDKVWLYLMQGKKLSHFLGAFDTREEAKAAALKYSRRNVLEEEFEL